MAAFAIYQQNWEFAIFSLVQVLLKMYLTDLIEDRTILSASSVK